MSKPPLNDNGRNKINYRTKKHAIKRHNILFMVIEVEVQIKFYYILMFHAKQKDSELIQI